MQEFCRHIRKPVGYQMGKYPEQRKEHGAACQGKPAQAVHIMLHAFKPFLPPSVIVFFHEEADIQLQHISDGHSAAEQKDPFHRSHPDGASGPCQACHMPIFHNRFMQQGLACITIP